MYHLFKQTRVYCGSAYCGLTSDHIPAEYAKLGEAMLARLTFYERNPVGWNIYDSETGSLVDGFDFHEEKE